MFVDKFLGDRQHAYRPNRGAVTAWKAVFSMIDRYDYIYEIDLKQCFPSIRSDWVSEKLHGLGMPEPLVRYLEDVNRSVPKFAQEDMTDESELRKKEVITKSRNMETYESDVSHVNTIVIPAKQPSKEASRLPEDRLSDTSSSKGYTLVGDDYVEE